MEFIRSVNRWNVFTSTFVYKEQAVNPLVIARRLMFVLTKQLLLLLPTEVWAKHLHTALKTDCCWGRTFSYRPLEFGCWGAWFKEYITIFSDMICISLQR